MSSTSRKRAGTLTYATPDGPSQRVRLSNTHQYHATLAARYSSTCSVGTYLKHLNGTISTPDTDEEATLLQQYSINRPAQESQPAEPAEYPFPRMAPIQPREDHLAQGQIVNKRLNLAIASKDMLASSDPIPISPFGGDPVCCPLSTPPRSHPSNPALFSESPPSRSYSLPASPGSSHPTSPSVPNSSAWPSFSTGASALSPMTPGTPVDEEFYDSAVASLREALKADVFGMSVCQYRDRDSLAESQLEDIKDFAAGRQRKRSGRVLVRSAIRMRSARAEQLKQQGKRRRSSISNNHMDTMIEAQQKRKLSGTACVESDALSGPPQLPDIPPAEAWWRDVNWSQFSHSIAMPLETSYIEPDSDEMDEDDGISLDYEINPDPGEDDRVTKYDTSGAHCRVGDPALCTTKASCEHMHLAEAVDFRKNIPVKISTRTQTNIDVDYH